VKHNYFRVEIFSLKYWYGIKRRLFGYFKVDKLIEFLEKDTFIRPNHITVVNFLVGLVAMYFLYVDLWWFSFLLIVCFILDNFDGYYARNRNLVTEWGKRLDHTSDFLIGFGYLVKSLLFYKEEWIAVVVLMFVFEMILIIKMKIWEEKFPTRVFLPFFYFGLYKMGLIAQLIIQPILFVGFLVCLRPNRK